MTHEVEPNSRRILETAAGDYRALLGRFPERRQGYGREPTFPGVKAQPMTVALVLMAEVRRFRVQPSDEGRRRVTSALRWLERHADRDRDGRPGWGLPDAWDAFGDGVGAAGDVNPADHPYTITTALALEALTDAAASELVDDGQRRRLGSLAGRIVERWCSEVFSAQASGGFFWYSPFEGDAAFCPNVSAMMAGAIRHAMATFAADGERWPSDPTLVARVDGAAQTLVEHARWDDDRPWWAYIEGAPASRPNDAVHHAYVLWGLDRYRAAGGSVALPWNRAQAVRSFDGFVVDGGLSDLSRAALAARPRRAPVPMRLWGGGMILATLARLGDRPAAGRWAVTVRTAFGPPSAPAWLAAAGDGTDVDPGPTRAPFYARHAAHLLLGLAELAFSGPDGR